MTTTTSMHRTQQRLLQRAIGGADALAGGADALLAFVSSADARSGSTAETLAILNNDFGRSEKSLSPTRSGTVQ